MEQDAVRCPSCGILIELDSFIGVGDPVFCPECETEYTLVSVDPLRLKRVSDAESEGPESGDTSEWYSDDDDEKGY